MENRDAFPKEECFKVTIPILPSIQMTDGCRGRGEKSYKKGTQELMHLEIAFYPGTCSKVSIRLHQQTFNHPMKNAYRESCSSIKTNAFMTVRSFAVH